MKCWENVGHGSPAATSAAIESMSASLIVVFVSCTALPSGRSKNLRAGGLKKFHWSLRKLPRIGTKL